MRVVIFTWEYPPRIVGQLANHVRTLAAQLVRNGQEAVVITYHDYPTSIENSADGVKIVRVTNPVHTHIGVLTWVLTLNQEVERAASNIYYEVDRQVNIIDVHDWHFIPAAVTIKKALNIPFVYSIDSLEEHRSHGANLPFNMAIKSIEWLGTYESSRVVVKSDWMRNEVARIYKVPSDKVTTVPSGSQTWIQEVMAVYGESTSRTVEAKT